MNDHDHQPSDEDGEADRHVPSHHHGEHGRCNDEREYRRGEHGHPHDDGVVILWKLNVQGIVIESSHPEITVRRAIELAGINPDAPWIIILKIAGEPKKQIDLGFVIDLRHKGIEKLRLTPRQINNGEAAARRSEFSLLPQDEAHLDRLGLQWETLIDVGRRWLVLRNYPIPAGYRAAAVDIAIEVPVSYPGSQLDMFYCHPVLALQSGTGIPQTQHMETITGLQFQRWSRHRQWDPSRDTLVTHLALIDESLRREVER